MPEDREFELIVQTIVERVQQQLGMQDVPALGANESDGAEQRYCASSPEGESCDATTGECTGCGLSVVRRPADTRKIIDLGAMRVSANAAGVDPALVRPDLAPYIDHTLLGAHVSRDELKKLCKEADQYHFASVCVNAANVPYCARALRNSDVIVCAVVGFPLGAMTAASKAFEAREAVRSGASEIDMVINIGALKSGNYGLVLHDIQSVVNATRPKRVKVILETAALSHDEKVIACALAKTACAAFVKTSTGFGKGGATAEDVHLMKTIVGEGVEVKASGGVRTADDADAMIAAGATRIGASASIAIVQGKRSDARPTRRKVGGY